MKSNTSLSKTMSSAQLLKLFTALAFENGMNHGGFLIHPEGDGYSFKLFFKEESSAPFQIVGSAPKVFTSKTGCVVCVKKLKETFSSGLFTDYIKAFDQRGKRIDLKVEYKKVW